MFRKGLVAISGDPITFGHIDLIISALQQCEEVIVGIANNPEKSYMFSLERRIDLARMALKDFDRVTVLGIRGLTADFYLQNGCDVSFRGIRNQIDSEYERTLVEINTSIFPWFRTEYVDTIRAHVSSTAAKELAKHHAFTCDYVPLCVQDALRSKLHRHILVGVTGLVAAGKSTLCRNLIVASRELNMVPMAADKTKDWVHHISFDDIVNELYDEDSDESSRLRTEISRRFGQKVLQKQPNRAPRIDKLELMRAVCAESPTLKPLQWLRDLLRYHVYARLRRKIVDKRGIILVEHPLLLELNDSRLFSNNVILALRDKNNIRKRGLEGTEYLDLMDAERIQDTLAMETLGKKVRSDGFGQLFIINPIRASKDDLSSVINRLTNSLLSESIL